MALALWATTDLLALASQVQQAGVRLCNPHCAPLVTDRGPWRGKWWVEHFFSSRERLCLSMQGIQDWWLPKQTGNPIIYVRPLSKVLFTDLAKLLVTMILQDGDFPFLFLPSCRSGLSSLTMFSKLSSQIPARHLSEAGKQFSFLPILFAHHFCFCSFPSRSLLPCLHTASCWRYVGI